MSYAQDVAAFHTIVETADVPQDLKETILKSIARKFLFRFAS